MIILVKAARYAAHPCPSGVYPFFLLARQLPAVSAARISAGISLFDTTRAASDIRLRTAAEARRTSIAPDPGNPF
jgi:hypothetical protein